MLDQARPLHGEVVDEICRVASVDRTLVVPGALLSDLVPDSYMLVELAVEIEETFDVNLTADEVRRLKTVQDVLAVVERHVRR